MCHIPLLLAEFSSALLKYTYTYTYFFYTCEFNSAWRDLKSNVIYVPFPLPCTMAGRTRDRWHRFSICCKQPHSIIQIYQRLTSGGGGALDFLRPWLVRELSECSTCSRDFTEIHLKTQTSTSFNVQRIYDTSYSLICIHLHLTAVIHIALNLNKQLLDYHVHLRAVHNPKVRWLIFNRLDAARDSRAQ